jgi:multiple sugar transport system ATP-binding protein
MGNVELENLTKRYGNETAVEGVDLDIEDGEFVTFVGPSGCGKSTTLEMVAGLTDATEGTVAIDGEDVTNVPPKNRRISMVFQNIALFPHMDVRDNISFGLRIRDFDDDEIERRVQRAAETVQIQGMLDRMPDELSGGQRQRVAIARAIVREPEVFLMDEPLANLDAALRVHMRTELQRLHDDLSTTIIYVTHDQEEAMTMSNRLAVINDGEVQQFDTPLECYNRPANKFVAGFIGSPSMNFVEGEMTADGISTPHFDLNVDPGASAVEEGRDLVVGIRPEDVALAENRAALDDPSEPISTGVDVVEPIGDEVYLYLLFDDDGGSMGSSPSEDSDQLLLSAPPNPEWDLDEMRQDSVDVHLDLARVHLFDAETGDSIVHGLTENIDASPLQADTD